MGSTVASHSRDMKAFLCILPCLLATASAAPQLLVRGAGQVSHQSVSKPFQGEHRSTVQSKAFGAGIASVSDSPNRLHGARGVIAHPLAHAVAHPVVRAPYAAPVVHAAPALAHPVAVAHAPAYGHPAPTYGAPDLAEVSPYNYNYAVADDYSGAAFSQAESNDGTGVVEGSYSVNLPDGRVQTVTYHANDYDGFISDVSYQGTPAYPPVATAVAHPLTATVAHPLATVAHPVATTLAHPVAPTIAHPLAATVAHPLAATVAQPLGRIATPLIG